MPNEAFLASPFEAEPQPDHVPHWLVEVYYLPFVQRVENYRTPVSGLPWTRSVPTSRL